MSDWTKGTWTQATPEQMLNRLKLDLDVTPKWRLFKRMELKRRHAYWKGVKL